MAEVSLEFLGVSFVSFEKEFQLCIQIGPWTYYVTSFV